MFHKCIFMWLDKVVEVRSRIICSFECWNLVFFVFCDVNLWLFINRKQNNNVKWHSHSSRSNYVDKNWFNSLRKLSLLEFPNVWNLFTKPLFVYRLHHAITFFFFIFLGKHYLWIRQPHALQPHRKAIKSPHRVWIVSWLCKYLTRIFTAKQFFTNMQPYQ